MLCEVERPFLLWYSIGEKTLFEFSSSIFGSHSTTSHVIVFTYAGGGR